MRETGELAGVRRTTVTTVRGRIVWFNRGFECWNRNEYRECK